MASLARSSIQSLHQALSEARAQAESTYRSVRQQAPTVSEPLRNVATSLRVLCGTLHSLSLLVEEISIVDEQTACKLPSSPSSPSYPLLEALKGTLDDLNRRALGHTIDVKVLNNLRRIQAEFRTAAEADDWPVLMVCLSAPLRLPAAAKVLPIPDSNMIQDGSATTGQFPDDSLDTATDCLRVLLSPEFDRKLTDCYSHRHYVAERNLKHPAYATCATRLPEIAEKSWDHLQTDLKLLFDPRKTTNFQQWILEYARCQWPEHFDLASGRAFSTTPLMRLMSAVSDSSLQTVHVAAALGLTSLCQHLLSKAEPGLIRESSPLGIPFYCALLGPDALLGRIDDPVQLSINARPSTSQEKTLEMLLSAGALCDIEPKKIGPGQDEPFSLSTLSFFVCHSLQASKLFSNIVATGIDFDMRFVKLFHGNNSLLRYWPSGLPALSPSFLGRILPIIIDYAVCQYDSYNDMSLLINGAFNVIGHYNLDLPSKQEGKRLLSVSDNAFVDLVREAVQDSEVKVVRRLIQDPRWDPNAFISGQRSFGTGTLDGRVSSPAPIKGTTLLHYAVESDDLALVRAILDSGEDVDIHARNKNDQTPLMLSESPEIFRLLHSRGARTTDTDDCGRNVWHFAAANSDIALIDCLVELDEHQDQNLRGLMTGGQTGPRTPIAQAIFYPFQQMKKQPKSAIRPPLGALHMLKVCNKDPAYLGKTPLLFLAAEWGSEALVASLIKFGADANVLNEKGETAVHFVNVSASAKLIKTLLNACNVPIQAPNGRTPAESIFYVFKERSLIGRFPDNPLNHPANSRSLDAAAYQSLLTEATLASEDAGGCGLWERFAKTVVSSWGPQWPAESTAGSSVTTAVDCLIEAGALAKYEEEHQKSGLIPVLFGWTQNPAKPDKVFPWLEDVIQAILAESSQTASFVESLEAIRCLELAIRQKHLPLAFRLLSLGVSIHARNGKISVLESACMPHTTCDLPTFLKLLDFADRDKLNDVNASGLGLLHRLIDGRVLHRDQKLQALLTKGCNPNPAIVPRGMGIPTHANGIDSGPLLVAYIQKAQINAALILLDGGADPSACNKGGLDAALAAAVKGSRFVLEKIKSLRPDFDWGRRCTFHYTHLAVGGLDTSLAVRNCTGLHFAAYYGQTSVLDFYINIVGLDVEDSTADELMRPLHLATMGRSLACVRVLLEHGADPTARMRNGLTPLRLAIRYRASESLRLFLEHAGIKNKRVEIAEAIHEAVSDNFQAAIQLLDPFLTEIVDPRVDEGQQGALKKPNLAGAVLERLVTRGDFTACERVMSAVEPSSLDSIRVSCGKCSPIIFALRRKQFGICHVFLEAGMRSWTFSDPCRRHLICPPFIDGGACHALHIALRQLGDHLHPGAGAVVARLLSSTDWTRFALHPMHCAALSAGKFGARLIVQHIREHPERYMGLIQTYPAWPQHRGSIRDVGRVEPLGNTNSSSSSASNDPGQLESAIEAIIRQVVNQRVATAEFEPHFDPGVTPLLLAISAKSLAMVEFLIGHGADIDMIDEEGGNTPLHEAVLLNFIEGARFLLQKGANHSIRNNHSHTPLYQAVQRGHLEMAKLLVEHGANLHVCDAAGMSLLSTCGQESNSAAMFVWLLNVGMDPYTRDKDDFTAVHEVILSNELSSLAFNYDFDFSRLGEIRRGFLSVVIEFNSGFADGVLRRLFKRLPPERWSEIVNSCPKAFNSPLCNAVLRDELACIRTLLDRGADIDAEGSTEGSALMAACASGRLDAVRILVSRGAKLSYSATLADGRRVSRSAVEYARPFPGVVRWLLVERHTSQRRLKGCRCDESDDAREVRPWSGVHAAGYELPGVGTQVGRRFGESSLEYLSRLGRIRWGLRGKIVRVVDLEAC